ncbi:MAG: hypothetical protein IJD92_00675 [Bacilli bacterium]|nr:hypothetical protein [Bacilli bacterium]
MKITLIIYAFLLGLINRNILCKIPVFYLSNNTKNIVTIIILTLITFIILEIFLYRKTTLKESLIVSMIRLLSYFLGCLIDYFIIYPQFNEIFSDLQYLIIHSITTRIIFFLISSSALVGLIISANKEDKWNNKKKHQF